MITETGEGEEEEEAILKYDPSIPPSKMMALLKFIPLFIDHISDFLKNSFAKTLLQSFNS